MVFGRVAPETLAVVQFCVKLSAASQGAFDATAGPRAKSLGALEGNWQGNWQDIEIDTTGQRLRKHAPLQIDLSGVAKGYAVDLAVLALQAAGMRSGHVNAGGDCRVFGSVPRPLKVRAPWDLRSTINLPDLHNASVATSASYLLDAPIISHGVTGRSIDPHISVTVFAPSCMAADALTKVVAVSQDPQHPLLAEYGAKAWLHRASVHA